MTPFQQARLWIRRAPLGERVLAGVCALVVVAAGVWVLHPDHSNRPAVTAVSSGSGSGGPASSASTAVATGGVTTAAGVASGSAGGASSAGSAAGVGPSGGSLGGGSGPGPNGNRGPSPGGIGAPATATASAPSARGSCGPAPTGTKGVTATQIKVAVLIVDIAGPAADSTFGVPDPTVQQEEWQRSIEATNGSGGVACRKLAPEYFKVNPGDQSGLQQTCLDMVQAGVFAVLDGGGFAGYPERDCFGENHLPYFEQYYITSKEAAEFYPYMFNDDSFDVVYKNTVYGLSARGFFAAANGFKKLGFIYRDCHPQFASEMEGWLRAVGVKAAQIVPYDVGCPSALASPSTLEQAVLKFQQAGVTNVTTAEETGDIATFTDVAQEQGFRPIYGFPDDGVIPISYGSLHPNYSNVAGAFAITPTRYGEERTPGMQPTAGTQKCTSEFAGTGQGTAWSSPYGVACDMVWFFAAAADHAPVLSSTQLAVGLRLAGSVDFSFPFGPSDFSAAGTTWGGQFWRVDRFMSSCNCWQVVDRTFHPSF